MADNMMRLAGRDPNTGLAKALTVETDLNGDGALRVVDAAPFAYDEVADAKRVQVVGSMTAVHTFVNVTASSTVILATNLNRKYLLIVNNSDAEIYINIAGTTASPTTGILLLSKGSFYEMTSGVNLVTGQITAAHASTGNKQILITEGV